MHYFINAYMENGGMLPNYACWGGLEASQRGVALTNFILVKMAKKYLEIFWMASTHYLISA